MKTVKQGQSFLDKITQLTGSFENALAMALFNDRSITDDVSIGLEIQTTDVTNKRVVSFFNSLNEQATAIGHNETAPIESFGIGTMSIDNTFIVT